MIEEQSVTEKNDLTDRDFYQQACSYFYYHAEQRTTMINFFIAVFAACIALYGSLLEKYPLASIFVACFLLIVSIIFCAIDLRNRFDVKQSQNVISQIEQDYGMDIPKEGKQYAYGVFSNEANVFKYYGYSQQRRPERTDYRNLKEWYKKNSAQNEKAELRGRVKSIFEADGTVSEQEIENSLKSRYVITLSFSIKMLYYMCMIISFAAIVLAVLIKLDII